MSALAEAPRPVEPGVQDVILVLADISGYTRFAAANRTALEHSQHLIYELILAVIREAEIPLEVAKLEGDAVFLYAVRREADWTSVKARLAGRLRAFFAAFDARLAELRRTITCNCEMCANVDCLRLKVIVHSGQGLFARVGRFDEVLGVDVIVAHRLLKNSVAEDEYLLVTEAAVQALDLPTGGARAGVETYEALGEVRTYVYAPSSLPEAAPEPPPAPDAATKEIGRLTRRGLLWGGVAVGSAFGLQRWLTSRPADGGIPWPLRRVLEVNERLSRDYFGPARLAPVFPIALAREPRENGAEGLADDFDPAAWKLRVEGLWGGAPLELSLAALKRLPHVEMVTELKCIEGWSEIVHWGGARLADLMAQHPPLTRSGAAPDVLRRPRDLVEYVSLETPGGGYYVGLDMESALHPQTLLCYEMNGQALTPGHGAPLRLVTPVKYGIKSIKRIGTLRFTDTRPADFWAERGYDWYSGH